MEQLSLLSLKAFTRARNVQKFYIKSCFRFDQLFGTAGRWTSLSRVDLLNRQQQQEDHITLLGKYIVIEVEPLCIGYEFWHVC